MKITIRKNKGELVSDEPALILEWSGVRSADEIVEQTHAIVDGQAPSVEIDGLVAELLIGQLRRPLSTRSLAQTVDQGVELFFELDLTPTEQRRLHAHSQVCDSCEGSGVGSSDENCLRCLGWGVTYPALDELGVDVIERHAEIIVEALEYLADEGRSIAEQRAIEGLDPSEQHERVEQSEAALASIRKAAQSNTDERVSA